MRQKDTCITVPIDVEGTNLGLSIDTVFFKYMYAQARKDGRENVEFSLENNGKTYTATVEFAEAKKLIRQSEIISIDIIPNTMKPYLLDLTQHLCFKPRDPIVKRENEIEKVWFYLSQKVRNNVFLIGELEVGKTAIAIETARQVTTGECPKEFRNRRILMLKPDVLLEKNENKRRLKYLVSKLEDYLIKNRKNIILFIDQAILMKTDEELIYMLYSMIKNHIPVMMTSSVEDYNEYFLNDFNIMKFVNYIYVEEPELEEVRDMVKTKVEKLQDMYGIKISDEMVKFAIYTSVLSESVSSNPGNAINVLERAFLEAKRKDKKEVDKKSILKCYNTEWRTYKNMTASMKKEVAYHEAGHYIAFINCKHMRDIKIAFVSILPTMQWGGVNMPYKTWDGETISTRDYFLDDLMVDFAGRVAERRVTNKNTSGMSGDACHANVLVREMVMKMGLSNDPNLQNRSFDGIDLNLIPEKLREKIEEERAKLIDEGYKMAEDLIAQNEELLKIIAERLFEEDILTGEQLQEICENYEKSNKR